MLPPTEQAPPKKSPLPLILGAVAVIAIAVAAFMFTRKTEPIPIDADPVANDAQPAPVTVTSKLLISAFPNGQLLAITRSDGVAVEVEQTELPLIIDLPEGNYDISFSYQGRTTVKKAVVSSSLPLSRVNAEFEVDADSFLLEDLK